MLMDKPVALESFHIKEMSDLKDGSLLVPKIVMVATHCPGKKLIDETGNEGQLDFLYDEVTDLGGELCFRLGGSQEKSSSSFVFVPADFMVVYVGIPRSVYPPFRHMVYHPKMVDILFPSQPILREWAETNSFITVCEDSDLTNMQKNVLKEWMKRPVDRSHQIYKSAENLSSSEWTYGEADFPQTPKAYKRSHSVPAKSHDYSSVKSQPQKSGSESGKTKRHGKSKLHRKQRKEDINLITLDEDDMELELYNIVHREQIKPDPSQGYGTMAFWLMLLLKN